MSLPRVHALDAKTGKELWNVKVDDHPNATITGTPTFHDGMLYVPVSSLEVTSAADAKYECCKFSGAVVALDARTGKVIWKAHTIAEEPAPVRTTSGGTRVFAPSGAPVWNAPTIDTRRGVLYVGSGENYSSPANDRSDAVLAFDLKDGQSGVVAPDAGRGRVECGLHDAGQSKLPRRKWPRCGYRRGNDPDHLANGKKVCSPGRRTAWCMPSTLTRRASYCGKTRVGRGGIQGGVHFGMALEGHAPVCTDQ